MKDANTTRGASNPLRLILRFVEFKTICFPVKVRHVKPSKPRLLQNEHSIMRFGLGKNERYTDNLDDSPRCFSFDL